ncbi:MAG: hypothetical protein IJW36_00995 [Clostridia bacterium]|nr:hypothetical protein [Clostridia bacterium]
MKIIDILKESATLLGLEEEYKVLEYTDTSREEEIKAEYPNIMSLFNLLKYSLKEFCTNYVPMHQKQTVQTQKNKFSLSTLYNMIRIQNIEKNSQLVKYKISSGYVELEEDGEYIVNYLAYPMFESFFDMISFLENLSPDVIVLGLCSYYALAHGMFEEFESLHEKYVEKAESLKTLNIFEMPSRRWE